MTFALDGWQGLSLLVSTVLPLLVGLVTTEVTSSRAKSLLLAALSAVSGFGAEVLGAHQAHQSYNLLNGALLAVAGFAVAVTTHQGLYKPTGLAAVVAAVGVTVQKMVPNPVGPVSAVEPPQAPDVPPAPVAPVPLAEAATVAPEHDLAPSVVAVEPVVASSQTSDLLPAVDVQEATTPEPPASA